MHNAKQLTIAACVVSALVHVALVAQHAASEPALAAAFITAAVALVVAAALLHSAPTPLVAAGTALLFAALIAAYVLDRTVGLPISDGHAAFHQEHVDALGIATKLIEALGAVAAASLVFWHEPARVRSDPPA